MLRFPLRSELILTKDQLAAVGSVAIESTYLERQLELTIWRLTGLDNQRSLLFTETMNLGPRIDVFRRSGDMLLRNEAKSDFLALVTELTECNHQRNVVIHGTWSGGHECFF